MGTTVVSIPSLPRLRTNLASIQCAEGILRVGIPSTVKGKQGMQKVCEAEVSLRTMSGEGIPWMARECGPIILKSLRKENIKQKKAAVILEPERIYTLLLELPPTPKNELEMAIRRECAKTIPEEITEITITWDILESSSSRLLIGVAAARTDMLQSYIDTATSAGMHVTRATTFAAAIFAFAGARKTSDASLLVSIRPGPERRGTVTVFYHYWPIDEAVIFPGTSDESIIATIQSLIEEYEHKQMPIEHIVFLGEQALEEKIHQQVRSPRAGKPAIDFEKALPKWNTDEWEWAGLRASCLAPDADLHCNFFRPKVKHTKLMIAGIAAGVVGLVGVGWLLFSLLPG